MKTAIVIVLLSAAVAHGQTASSNTVTHTSTQQVQKAEKKVDPNLKTYTGKVKSKDGGNLIIVLNESDTPSGVLGSGGGMGYSLVNQGPSKPKKVLGQGSSEQREMLRKREEAKRTVTVVGHTNITAVMIGSTITFQGVKKGQTITIASAD